MKDLDKMSNEELLKEIREMYNKTLIENIAGRFKAKKMGTDDWVIGFFTKVCTGNIFIPVIQVIKECDSGDYIESYEIDSNTLTFEAEILKRMEPPDWSKLKDDPKFAEIIRDLLFNELFAL